MVRSPMRYTTIPPAPLASRLTDRQFGHQLVMATLPDGLGPDARSASNALWRWDPHRGRLEVQASCPIEAHRLGQIVDSQELPIVEARSRWYIDVEMDLQKTPPSQVPPELRARLREAGGRAYRSRQVLVPRGERTDWCRARFARCGFDLDPSTLRIGDLTWALLGNKRGRIPYVRVTASGTVTDSEVWATRLRTGLGKGRSYGLGLVIATPISRCSV